MTEFEWVAVAVTVVLSSARLTRLATYDEFPPVRWLRDAYGNWADARDWARSWALLAYCGYCMSIWMTLLVVLSGYLSDWNAVWWLVNGSLGASYLAATYMTHDGDSEDEAA